MLAWIGGSKRRLRSHLHKRPRVAGVTVEDRAVTDKQGAAGLQARSKGEA